MFSEGSPISAHLARTSLRRPSWMSMRASLAPHWAICFAVPPPISPPAPIGMNNYICVFNTWTLINTMMRSSNETFSASLAICAGNSPVPGEFPAQTPVTRSFDVFFDLRLNKRFGKQPWGWWFETPSHPLWHHGNDIDKTRLSA